MIDQQIRTPDRPGRRPAPGRADRHGLGLRSAPGVGDRQRRRPRHPGVGDDDATRSSRRRSSRSRAAPTSRSASTCAPTPATPPARCDLLIEHGVKVASFALAPKPELIAKLKEHDIVVMPSIGAAQARGEGRRLGRRRRDGAGRRGRRPHRSGADRRCCCPRCSTPSTSRSSPRVASSTAAASPPRCRTAPPASAWAPASC